MENRMTNKSWRSVRAASLILAVFFIGLLGATIATGQTPAPPQRNPAALGTIKSISANELVLTTDAGVEVKVQLPADVKVLRVPPGSKDLKEAAPMQLSDLQQGDRILVRMKPSDDGSSMVATAVIAMKAADIAQKQAKERSEWQTHGIGGLVKSVDAGAGTITIGALTPAGSKDVVIHLSKDTILRRYAQGSVRFDEAKPAPIIEIHAGDQLRARGTRGPDGLEFTADEIVSGSFRNIAGTVNSVDSGAGTITVTDLATKKPVEVKISSDSQMRKLPQMMAQRIAMRLKGDAAGPGTPASVPGTPAGQAPAAANGPGSAAPGAGGPGGAGNTGMGASRNGGGGGDMQQMLSRLPASTLNDFQKGDAVMIVATSGQGGGPVTAITLLGGVEPILQSSTQGQAASILSPWTLNQGGGGDAGTP